MAEKRVDAATGTQTMGHEWDGIEELDTPMPRWWLWTFYATILFSLVYVIAYPAWPLINRATAGVLGWTSTGQLQAELAADAKAKAPVNALIDRTPMEQIVQNPQLLRIAQRGGAAAFRANCVQCHGSGAAGFKGYPNLNDDDWLWGGDLNAIHQTLLHGIRYPGNEQTRASAMPAFGRDGILTPPQIDAMVSYVRAIAGQEPIGAQAQSAAPLYQANCAACHGADGKGNRAFGAPNLTDAIWLYGGDRDSLTTTIAQARNGVMPAWTHRLDPVTIKMLALYVHSLGGGEAPGAVPAAPPPAPPAPAAGANGTS